MLRVTVHEDRSLCRLELAGRLDGPWVAETEQAWHSSLCSAKQIEVDVRQLTGVDDCGKRLLAAMHREGARLVAEGVWMRTLIEEIVPKQPCNRTTQRPSRTLRKPQLPD
jgi:ABC-type transporter Mla MlaB component